MILPRSSPIALTARLTAWLTARLTAWLTARLTAQVTAAAVLVAAQLAAAQTPRPVAPPPLAQLKDAKQLAEVLQSITQDPAITVDDPAIRRVAQALLSEAANQLQARAYEQALANLLEAYARFPSPRILLDVGSTLDEMGRLADAANTYQRYLNDPATGSERVAEIKEVLGKLDRQLTILTVTVKPRSSEISIDGGPFIRVGGSLLTRVRPGLHVVRIRMDNQSSELAITGAEGEDKEVAATLEAVAREPEDGARPVAPERVDGWLITGTQYGAPDAGGRNRTVRGSRDGRALAAILPHREVADRSEPIIGDQGDSAIEPGALAVLRIDGKGRGFAGGFGLAIARGKLEAEVMVLKSNEIGGYVGARYGLFTGFARPYGALGVPGFVYDHDSDLTPTTSKRLAVGVRVAAGLELVISDHLSVLADIGYEHFFFVEDHFEADLLVPTLGVIGRP